MPALPPGRDLDVVIAMEIMQFHILPEATIVRPAAMSYVKRSEVAPYSTDFNMAMLVVNRMHAQVADQNRSFASPVDPWPHANYLTLACRGTSEGWAATFTCVMADNPEWYEYPEQIRGAVGATAAHAICLAALAALSADPDTSLTAPVIEDPDAQC
jgi:hypothetical protein